ncbi:MAG: hypothetical protein JW863_12340 [Chitinispirillaceae bacterium]|nr:hypothetical protein [Chitinispirillaceae bacterium]
MYSDTCKERADTVIFPSTIHRLFFLNQELKPVDSLLSFRRIVDTVIAQDTQYTYTYASGTMETAYPRAFLRDFPIYPEDETVTLRFREDEENSPYIAEWSGRYVDDADTVLDTVYVVPTGLQRPGPVGASGDNIVSFSALRASTRVVKFVIGVPQAYGKAVIAVYSIAGKKVAELPVHLDSRGTHTVTWSRTENFHPGISGGRYLCRLESNGVTLSVRQVSLY